MNVPFLHSEGGTMNVEVSRGEVNDFKKGTFIFFFVFQKEVLRSQRGKKKKDVPFLLEKR
jgi:hypothetical protein